MSVTPRQRLRESLEANAREHMALPAHAVSVREVFNPRPPRGLVLGPDSDYQCNLVSGEVFADEVMHRVCRGCGAHYQDFAGPCLACQNMLY